MPNYKFKPGSKHYVREKDAKTGKSKIRLVRPDEAVFLTPQAARALRDKLVTAPVEADAKPDVPEPEGVKLYIVSAEDGMFNVINPETNEPINDEPLSQEDAQELLEAADD